MLTWYFIETLRNCCRHNRRRPWLQLCPKSHWKVSTKSGMGLDLPQQGHRWECEVVESCSRIMCWASKWKNLAMVQTYCTNIPTFHSKFDKFWFYGSKHSNIPLHILRGSRLLPSWWSCESRHGQRCLDQYCAADLEPTLAIWISRLAPSWLENQYHLYSFTMSHSIWVAMRIHIPTPYWEIVVLRGGVLLMVAFQCFVHANESYRCCEGDPIVLQCFVILIHFQPLLTRSSLILTRARMFSKTLMRPKKYPAYYSLHDLHPHSIQTKFTYISWERKRFLVFLL